MQFYNSVMSLGLPYDIHEEKPSFLEFKKTNYGPTNQGTNQLTKGPTDGPTDQWTDPLI